MGTCTLLALVVLALSDLASYRYLHRMNKIDELSLSPIVVKLRGVKVAPYIFNCLEPLSLLNHSVTLNDNNMVSFER